MKRITASNRRNVRNQAKGILQGFGTANIRSKSAKKKLAKIISELRKKGSVTSPRPKKELDTSINVLTPDQIRDRVAEGLLSKNEADYEMARYKQYTKKKADNM